MPALTLKITDNGLNQLANVGTLGPVTITKIAVGNHAWTTPPVGNEVELISEVKRIPAGGISNPDNGRIHITATDQTADVYDVREIGLYANGVSGEFLFAIAGGPDIFVSKYASTIGLYAVDLDVSDVPSGDIILGDAEFIYQWATESDRGIVRLALLSEALTGGNSCVITPGVLAPTLLNYLPVSGGTMSGQITLPTGTALGLNGNHAARKDFVTTNFLPLAGGTTTGPITLPGAPSSSLHAATKAYVDGTKSLLPSGYQIFPSGLIMQWGITSLLGKDNSETITLPIPFTTAILSLSVTPRASSAHSGGTNSGLAFPTSLTTITITNESATGTSRQLYWQAIGY